MSLPLLDPARWRTLRARLTIWNTAVVLAMAVIALLAARFAARATIYDDADAELRAGALEVVYALDDLAPDLKAVVAEIRRKAASHETRGWFVHLLTEDGSTIWRSDHCPPEVLQFPPAKLQQEENVVQVGPYRYVRRRIARPDGPAYHVRVGTYTTGLDENLASLVRLLFVVGAFLLLLTPLAGWWLAGRATRPLQEILGKAERLKPTRLGDRLTTHGTQDELDRLAVTINRLLDQVAEHVDRQQHFVADAAHELRGPLAAMRSTVDVALAHDRTAADYRDTLVEVLEQAGQLSNLANALLTLAESAADGRSVPTETIDLAAIARQSVGMFAGVGEDRGVAVELGDCSDVKVAGDAAQMRQVLGNLLDNAIRHTPNGGRVTVDVARDAKSGDAILTVADTGSGIEARHLDHVFDRFYQADTARTRGMTGRTGGLGLAICKAIVDRHGGSISLQSAVGRGTTATIRLAAAA